MSGRGKRPAHQNSTAFKHNPNSRLTARIAAIPNDGLCHRCHAIIEWRKKYRKYKPLSQPRKCNQCQAKTVRFAYHTRCSACSQADKSCAKCGLQRELVEKEGQALGGDELLRWMSERGVRERRRRLVMRQWEGGERTDDEIREMVNKYAAEAASRDGLDDDDDWDDEDGEEENDEDEREERDERKQKESTVDQKSSKQQPLSSTSKPSTASTSASTAARPAVSSSTVSRGVDKLTLLKQKSTQGGTQSSGGGTGGGTAPLQQAMSDEDESDDDADFD